MPRESKEVSKKSTPVQIAVKKMKLKKPLGGTNPKKGVWVVVTPPVTPLSKECTDTTSQRSPRDNKMKGNKKNL